MFLLLPDRLWISSSKLQKQLADCKLLYTWKQNLKISVSKHLSYWIAVVDSTFARKWKPSNLHGSYITSNAFASGETLWTLFCATLYIRISAKFSAASQAQRQSQIVHHMSQRTSGVLGLFQRAILWACLLCYPDIEDMLYKFPMSHFESNIKALRYDLEKTNLNLQSCIQNSPVKRPSWHK